MERDKVKRMLAWDARRNGGSERTKKLLDIAVDNGFALRNHKERSDLEREILEEDLFER